MTRPTTQCRFSHGCTPPNRPPRRAASGLMRWVTLLTTLTLGAGCTPDFDPVWLVKDLRILAVQADPPEVLVQDQNIPIPPVHLEALVVDPRAPQRTVDWRVLVCTAEDSPCEEAEESYLAHEATTVPSEIGLDLTVKPELIMAALEADPLRGFGGLPVQVELQVDAPDMTARAIKRLVFGVYDPAEKQPNENPTIDQLLVDDAPAPAELTAPAGTEVKLWPETPEEAKEDYLVATFEGGSLELNEYLSYAFFTTNGDLSHAVTGGRPNKFVVNKKVTDISSYWTPSLDPASTELAHQPEATLWVVARDDRGGVTWTSLTATVTNP